CYLCHEQIWHIIRQQKKIIERGKKFERPNLFCASRLTPPPPPNFSPSKRDRRLIADKGLRI
ncbi:MAG: hypothetical protein LBP89_10145, partial [Helicobacteraceae bacterium]|nr:hypothetical protein [Helicobacteraceae bacterium]